MQSQSQTIGAIQGGTEEAGAKNNVPTRRIESDEDGAATGGALATQRPPPPPPPQWTRRPSVPHLRHRRRGPLPRRRMTMTMTMEQRSIAKEANTHEPACVGSLHNFLLCISQC